MRPIIDMTIALAACAWFTASVFAQTATPPKPNSAPLWTATAPDRPTLLLLPTIHKLALDDPRVDDWLSQIAGRAEAVVLEAPFVLGKEELSTVFHYGLYPPQDNISNHVTTLTPEALARCAKQSNLNLVRFFQAKPWLDSMVVNVARMQNHTSLQTDRSKLAQIRPGIDERLLNIAQRNMMPVIYLETLDQALTIFDDMPADEQEAQLAFNCAIITSHVPGELDLGAIEKAWLDSDITGMEQLLTRHDPLENQWVYDADQRVIHEGTKYFAAAIEKYGYFHGKGPILVAVGAAHFVGDDSLLDRLKSDGYTITPPSAVTRTACVQKPDLAVPASHPSAKQPVDVACVAQPAS